MATVSSTPTIPFNRGDADRRVRHPLSTVRGCIRRYVLTEGLALAILFTAICFWLGLAIDYSLWSAFSFDWLYSFNEITDANTPTLVLRLAILLAVAGTLAALVAFKIFVRMHKEFSDSAVALLLERRYPKQLGDRLITAVELADPKLSEKYGFSQAMVDATIRDAAERVEKLPVQEAFRWGRLKLLVAMALVGSIGIFLLVGAAWCAVYTASPLDFLVRFHHTASIWTERNVFMMNSYWPPDTIIELVRFPGAELRVPREENRPDVKARYIRWAIADNGEDAPRGWRALRFDELHNLLPKEMIDINLPPDWDRWLVDLDDLDSRVPAGAIPAEWGWQGATTGKVRQELSKEEIKQVLDRSDKSAATRTALYEMLKWRNWTVDKIELQLKHFDKKTQTWPVAAAMMAQHKDDYDRFLAILAKLEELAVEPAMGRTLRIMDEPTEVVALTKSKTRGGSVNCVAVDGHKFLFQLADLKESCQFRISTGDYWTPWRQITLVPPPMLDQFRIDKDEPAYRYYRMLDNPALLKAKKQRISSTSVSTSGSFSKIFVPVGTDVTIVAHSDRPLSDIRVAEPDAKKREEKTSVTEWAPVELGKDKQTFTCSFKDLRRTIEFDFEFKDRDGVRGTRRVILRPEEDREPRINELAVAVMPRLLETTAEGAREAGGGPRWVITPDAFLKLRGKVEDDFGLTQLQYQYILQEVDFQNLFVEPTETPTGEPPPPDPKKPARGVGAEIVVGGMQFVPGPSPFGFFAASYYGGLAQVVKDGSLPPPPPRTALVDLGRAKELLTKKYLYDVTPAELERLLTIQPAYRKLLLEALAFKAEKRTLVGFAERLKDANQTEGFLREVMNFAGIAAGGSERARLEKLAAGDAAEALAQILQKLKADAEELKVTQDLLEKQPETTITTAYNLQQEDVNNGFDVREQLRFIKAIGSTSIQKHHLLKLSIIATDNNVFTGPGVASAALQHGFLIVSENELLTLMLRDQRRYHDILQATVQELEQKRQLLESQFIDYKKTPEEPTRLLVRADAARKALRAGGGTTKQIFSKFEALLKEMDFNRVKEERIRKLRDKVVLPLGALTDNNGLFPKTEEQAAKFCKELSPDADKKDKADAIQQGDYAPLLKELEANKQTHIANAELTLTQMTDLIRELNIILDRIREGVSENDLLERLVYIEAMQHQLDQGLREYEVMLRRWFVQQLQGDLGGKDKK